MNTDPGAHFFDEQTIEKLRQKRREFGPYVFTLEDHISMGSTPPDILKENPGVPHHKLLTQEEKESIVAEYEEALIGVRDQFRDQVEEELESTKHLFGM